MKTEEVKYNDNLGPASYRNWLAKISAKPISNSWESPLYSDAHIAGEIIEGLGPYKVLNALAVRDGDPALVLVINNHLPSLPLSMDKTNIDSFTGALLQDEIASLLALASGARIMAGGITRELNPDGSTYTINGDHIRPAIFSPMIFRGKAIRVLPKAVDYHAIDPNLIALLPTLTAEDATALIRAARSYRDAIWIAEINPELSWLLLVSSIEVAAVHFQTQESDPLDILRETKPDMVKQLENISKKSAEVVATAFAEELRAANRFLQFIDYFKPNPPQKRPKFDQLDWSSDNIRKIMKIVYGHRSKALHKAIPFPPPMCNPPRVIDESGIHQETNSCLAASSMQGVWENKDIPILLHTFEFIVRGSLINWWKTLSESTTVQK